MVSRAFLRGTVKSYWKQRRAFRGTGSSFTAFRTGTRYYGNMLVRWPVRKLIITLISRTLISCSSHVCVCVNRWKMPLASPPGVRVTFRPPWIIRQSCPLRKVAILGRKNVWAPFGPQLRFVTCLTAESDLPRERNAGPCYFFNSENDTLRYGVKRRSRSGKNELESPFISHLFQ